MEKPKIMLWDIETSWGLRPDLTHLLCIAWKWLGQKKVYVSSIEKASNWPRHLTNDKNILKRFLPEFSRADNVISWYGIKFDEPYIRARAAKYRIPPPPFVHHTDLWQVCRKEFGLSSNRLENAAEYLGVEHSKEKLSHYVWHRAQYGNRADLHRIIYRCKIDVLLLEDIYMVMRPYIRTNRFNQNTVTKQKFCCAVCGSKNIVRNGRSYTLMNIMQKYFCRECGAHSRSPVSKKTGVPTGAMR